MRLKIEEELQGIAKAIYAINNDTGAGIIAQLDGTAAGYRKVMRKWFFDNGVNVVTEQGLTELVDKWYELTKTGWDGGTRFYQPGVSSSSNGTKVGDNETLSCTPSTNTVKNRDDYEGLPLFATIDCNFTVNPTTLEPIITAIAGITPNFKRNDPGVYVGVLQQGGYVWQEENDTTYTIGYSDINLGTHGKITPMPETVRASDNTVRSWMVHAKYMSQTVGGKMTSCAGLTPTAFVSHNSIHSLSKANGSQYSGSTASDWSFSRLMGLIKYGSLTLDGILQGCVDYNFQYYAKVAEAGVNRILLTTTEGAIIIVGSTVLLGNYTGNTDRSNAGMYNITGVNGAKVTKKETVTVNGTNYTAIYVDTANTFDTAANGSATTGTTYLSTWHWQSGSCDDVLGNDGSPNTPGNGRELAKLQGIEYSVGGYEVLADVILKTDGTDYEPYTVNRSASQATSITSAYKASGMKSALPASAGWNYIRKHSYNGELFFGTDTNGESSSTYTRDGFYKVAKGTSSTYEWLAFGDLARGVAAGGLSCLTGGNALSSSSWGYLARLSPNGNRGELAA